MHIGRLTGVFIALFEYKPSMYLTPSIVRSTGPSLQTCGADFRYWFQTSSVQWSGHLAQIDTRQITITSMRNTEGHH